MKLVKIAAIGIAAAAASLGGVASAQTYDAVTNFGGSVFSYGSGTGTNFTSLTAPTTTTCVGVSGLSCYYTPNTAYTFPAIAKNLTAGTLTFYTNVLPTDELFFQTNPGTTATLRFTAATAGTYVFAGEFVRIDSSNGAGDGVTVGFTTTGASGSAQLANSLAGASSSYTYDIAQTFVLAAGQHVDFFQDANGNVNNDGTGFQLTVTAVPEPATWAMMISGLAMVGFAARGRRKAVKVTYA